MKPTYQRPMRMVILTPSGVEDLQSFSPFAYSRPQTLAFCCFFSSEEERAALLKRLRSIAGEPPPPEEERDTATHTLAAEYALLQAQGETEEALCTLIRWWSVLRRQSYHAYSLRQGIAPFLTSCLITFDEWDKEAVRYAALEALEVLRMERSRVLDFFGLGEGC
jgi:hypothetical protein